MSTKIVWNRRYTDLVLGWPSDGDGWFVAEKLKEYWEVTYKGSPKGTQVEAFVRLTDAKAWALDKLRKDREEAEK